MYGSLEVSLDDYLSEIQINNISNFSQGCNLLEERDLLFKFVNNLDDIKKILRLKYHPKQENNENTKYQDLYETYPTFMKKLGFFLTDLKEYLELPEFKREMGEIYKISESQIESKMDDLKKMIEKTEFPILTAGETKAGKSTFINLLLGQDLLPMDIVTCTRIICEIKRSDNKSVTFSGPGKKDLCYDLSANTEDISSKIKQENRGGYTKAIFSYPVKFLDNYTYLVDSPGIGDSLPLEKMTFDYLNNFAPAFIYVLNATNANGLTIKARELIEKAKQDLTQETNKYITDLTNVNQVKEYYSQYYKAIFVLNHWDTVQKNAESKEEVEEVRKIIIEEIKSLWHESVKENEQIFFISARQANEWQKHGYVQTEIINIRNCIRKLIVKLYQKNIENSLELLNIILQNMEKQILQKINATIDKKYCKLYDKSNAERLCQKLENVNRDMESRKAKIREQLRPKFEIMAKCLTDHLKSNAVKERILQIKKPEITDNYNMDLLSIVFRKLLETKLYEEIKQWEKDTRQMGDLYSFLSGLFEENLIQISNEIKISNTLINKESLIKAWNSTNQSEITNFDQDFITKIEKVFIISTVTLLFPVVALAGLLATPVFMIDLFIMNKINGEKLEAYKNDPDEYVRTLLSSSLQNLSPKKINESFFINVQRKCEDYITTFEKFVTIEIKEKRQLIKDIEAEKREIPEILKSLSDLYYRVENCYGEYHNLKNTNEHVRDQGLIVPLDKYVNLIKESSRITKYITNGKHSVIFKNEYYPFHTFKTYNKKFFQANARFQMQEINLLVTAPDYILRCKHICILDKEEKILLVLDNVDCNLTQYLMDNSQLIPGKHEKNSDLWKIAFRFIICIGIKICRGIRNLHSYETRMVHPDLRLDTILVKKSNIPNKIKIYICDACSNLMTPRNPRRSHKDLKETYEDMGGHTKENINRLGYIFYKLAHFEDQSQIRSTQTQDHLNNLSITEVKVKIDWNHQKHDNIPASYNKLIKHCLSEKPENRPNIDKCIEKLQEIKNSNLF